MKKLVYFIFFCISFLAATISCSKPDIVAPDDKSDVEVEAPDTTEKSDTVISPEEPGDQEELISSLTAVINHSVKDETGWKTSWVDTDAINLFSTAGKSHDDAAKWINHGKLTFDSQTENTFVGSAPEGLESGKTRTYHAIYPYSEQFTDPAGIDAPYEDQMVTIGHLPGEYITQKGNNNTDHLGYSNMPMYAIANSIGNKFPNLTFRHMAAVYAIEVKNVTDKPMTVKDIKIEHSMDYLVGLFAVDVTYAKQNNPSYDVFRNPINASKEVCLKVVDAQPIPVNESAFFYIPIMANCFWWDTELTITVNDFVHKIFFHDDYDVYAGKFEHIEIDVYGAAKIDLMQPSSGADLDLSALNEVHFEWSLPGDQNEYTILFSSSEDIKNPVRIDVDGSSLSFSVDYFDHLMHNMGLNALESGKVYWTVIVRGDERIENISSFDVTRRASVPYEERIAESLTIPVAILVEDPIYPPTGKRITEMIHNGWGYKWNDPYVQMKEFERDMESSSHNVVQYEVVKIVESDRLFSYYRNSVSDENKEYMTVDTLVNYHFKRRVVDNITYYDYVGMMQHYGFDKMVDAGEIKEVWVYTHPASGMNESRLIGDGAFWCNSVGIGTGEATNKELCCVMFCNYERTTDLAMHSYAHRVESIMSQVYERKGGLKGWNYDIRTHEELTNWEKYSAYKAPFQKYKDGYAHIGCCHFPANGASDYDYENPFYVMSYADTWYDYPDIREDDSVARSINKKEWEDAGGYQWGYMKWYFGHLPHFKGICPRDGHLNNWWHYIVDYNNALIHEEQVRSECIY